VKAVLSQTSTFSQTMFNPFLSKALVIASLERIFHHLKTATHGIIFLGTPHRGSDNANLAIKVASIAKMIYPGIQTQNIKSLQRNSSELQDLADNFRNLHSQLEIVSCYEMEPKTIGLVGFHWNQSAQRINLLRLNLRRSWKEIQPCWTLKEKDRSPWRRTTLECADLPVRMILST
jgi:hypothetical protein